jgi:glycosyltransferase involved in cell wall biosynthesis
MTGAESPARPVLFLSNYFPPEVNALARRTFDHAKLWAEHGGVVGVIAGPPHFPEGRVHEGYGNRLTAEQVEGIQVLRVPMLVRPNRGFALRTLSYLSYMASAVLFSGRCVPDAGVVVASSPQFFAGLAGAVVARRRGVPFVLEVRDLWPESILAVGAMRRSWLVDVLERLETALYHAADRIVVVSPAFRDHIEARGVSPERIVVLPNGIVPEEFGTDPSAPEVDELRAELGLEDRFIVSYVGTVGMAHGLEVVVEAARLCPDPEVRFVVVGAGAGRAELKRRREDLGLDTVLLLDRQPRERVPLFHALSDVAVVPLRDRPAFRKVIPSKLLEAMGAGRPVVLGVGGQARAILEEAGGGIAVPPEDPRALLEAVLRLKSDPGRRAEMGHAGREHVRSRYDRRTIARSYWELLQQVARRAP